MAGSGFTQLNYCFHCMSRLEPDDPVCPVCGHDNSIRENNSSALPEGTILAGKYLVGRVLGQGGFGITYLGFSTALNMRVAIKEYFPTTIAMRSGNSRRAGEVTSFKDPEGFRKGREEFQAEAMTLARFNSRHIVHVRDYFMENGTGYIVMDYVEGLSLTDLVKESGGSLPWDRVVELFKPLMLELNSLHEEHLIHRDIKPDNIRLTAEKDGSEHLVLLDFGSARSFVSAEITQTYTAMITPGYSPYEQYSRHSRQGPYTDIYSLCATMYALITGTVPPDSAARNIGDVVIRSFEEMGVEVPEQVSRAIMHGLSIRREDRPQTMVELYAEITGKPPVTKAQEPVPAKENIPSEKAVPAESGGTIKPKDLPAAPAPEKKRNLWLLPLLLAVLLAGGFFLRRNMQQNRMNTASTQTAFSLTETANVLQTAAAAARTQEYAEQLTVQAQAAETSTQDALLAEQTATAWGSTVAAESGQTQTAEAAALAQQTMQVETARVQGTQSAATSTAFSETRIAELHQTQTEAALSTQLVYGEQTAAAQTATQSYEDMLSTRAVWEQQTAEVMEATQQAIIIAQTAMIKTQEAVNTETAGKRTQAAMEITQTEIARAQQELNATQTKMAEPTATFTPSPTATATVTPTAAPTLTATPSPTATETPTDTPVPTATEAPKAALPEAGDVITFGEYEQDNDLNNGAEPIEWQVLAVEDGRALLISKYALDVKPYNETDAEVTWETSTLRKWLNGDFLFTAFSTNEQARIPEIMNLNPDNERFRTFGGNATDDRIFLLSSDEAERYFSYSYEARKCSTTAYAEAKGAFISPVDGTVWWWLRTPGIAGNMAAGVDPDGAVFLNGIGVDSSTYLVRPALWLDLTETSAPAPTDIPPETAATVINAEKLQAGDELTFGIYEQDNDLNNGAEPIEWLVLAVEDDRALLISKYSLDARPYNETKTEVTWETCTLRNWLNGNFFNSAFSSDEKARIFTVINQNPNNPDSDADGGNPTTDQIFLLSIDEAYQYFEDDDIRKCSATAYAKANGAFVPSYWWLRSPGWENNSAASVGPNGYVFAFGDSAASTDAGIRPALWLDLTVSESSVSFEIPEPTATNTVTPTETPQPTATETPVPTDTPQPTATNTPDPTLEPTAIPTEKQSSGSPYTITRLETEKVESGDYLVTEDVLIRDNPSSSGAVVRAVLTGSKVTSQGKEQNGYMLIKTTEGQEGWISANLLTTEEQINITGSAEISIADLKEDDIFIFGQFEQDNDLENGAEPIEWQVLAIENGQALVISRYGLDAMTYSGNVWEVCNQREWLNSDFLESAFTWEEQDLIAEMTLDNPDSTYLQPYYENGLRIPGNYDVREFSNIGGKSTKDRIFLLNNDEADKYFENDESRRCQATDYAISNGAFVSSNGNTMWWLRSGFIVDSSGAIVYSSNGDYTWITVDNTTKKQINTFIEYTNRVVRPAFWLDLTGENESETETVITDTQETQTPAETSDAATETTITQTPVLTETETAEPEATETPVPTAVITPVSLAAGDTLNFGSYEQDNNASNGPEAIEWIVLDTDGDSALLLSKAGLEVKPYHEGSLPAGLTWESCSLRSWLNGEFFETAFSPEEQNAIISADVSYPDKAGVADDQGTSDMVYLLGAKEAKALLSDSERIITATDHAAAQGAAGGTWWLRSPGFNASYAIRVDGRGAISDFGMDAGDKSTLVRPVIRLDCGEDLAGIITRAEAERTAQKAIAEQEAARQKEANRHAASIPGTILTFGSYEQDNKAANGKEAIEWIVLDSDGDKSLLLSRYGLEGKPYNYEYSVVTWEKSSLRNWLNNTFPNNAFTPDEQEAVIETLNTNPDNPVYGTNGGNDTTDKLFLLSFDELNRYLPNESERLCAPTDYAIWQGASVDYNTEVDNRPVGMWWLRTPGNSVTCHDCEWSSSRWGCLDRQAINGWIINYQGESDVVDVSNGQGNPEVYLYCGVPNNHYAVRPAFWLDLDSDDYQIAAPYIGSPGEPVKIEKGLEAYAENSVIMDPDESSEDQVILHISGLFSFEYLEEKDYIFVIDDADRTALALAGRSDGAATARDLIVPDGCPARSITLRAPEGKELTVNLNGKSSLNSAFTMSGLNIYANGVPFTIADGLTLNGASIYGGGTAKLGNISSVPKARIVIDGGVDAVYGGGSAIDGLTIAIVGETEIIINGTVRNSVYAGGHALGGASAAVEKASVLLGETGKVGMNVVATGYASGAVPKNYTVTINGKTTINDGEGEVLICNEYGHCYNATTYGVQFAAFKGKTNDYQIDSSSHVGTVILDIRGTVGNQVLKIATNSLVSVDQVLEQEIAISQ